MFKELKRKLKLIIKIYKFVNSSHPFPISVLDNMCFIINNWEVSIDRSEQGNRYNNLRMDFIFNDIEECQKFIDIFRKWW